MLLKFFKNKAHETTTYTNHEEIFNPHINHCWFDSPLEYTVRQHFALIKQIYTRDNLTNNPELLTNINHHIPRGYIERTLANLTKDIPNDKLWVLNWISLDACHMNSTVFAVYKPQARITLHADEFRCRFDDVYVDLPANYSTTSISGLLYEQLLPIIERLESLFAAHADKQWSTANSYSVNNFVRNLTLFTSNVDFIASTNEYYNAQKLFLMGPDIKIICRRGGGNSDSFSNFSLRVSVKVSKANKSPLYTVFSYSTSPMEMLPYPVKFKNEHNPVLYGVELECSTDYGVRQIIDATDEPFMLAKSDASVTGNKRNNYELVTVPMSFKAHKREWAKWFSKLEYDKFDTTKDTNNGMHVHIGRTHFDNDKHIRNLAWFINNPAHRDFMTALSERTAYSVENYAPMRKYSSDANKTRAMRNVVSEIRNMRGACNVASNKPTIEIRLFKGIVSYAAVLKNLECVDAMFNFSREFPVYKMTLRMFLTWLEQQPYNKYPVFKKFVFAIKNIKKMAFEADMNEVIFTSTDPDKIMKKMTTAGIKITNEHVTTLNKRIKKRTFILNKETGKIEVIHTNKFPLAHLDRDLEKRYVNL